MYVLPDGSAFFVGNVGDSPVGPPIKWNPFNKVVQDHRDGIVYREATDIERAKRGLKVPWRPEFGNIECREAPVL